MTPAFSRLPVVVASAVAFSGCGGSCAPPPFVPSSQTCGEPATTFDLDTIEIGVAADGGFFALADGDVIQPISGGQGAEMILAHLRVSGPGVPACLAQNTGVYSEGDLVGSFNLPMATTLVAGDVSTRITGDMFLVLDYLEYGQLVTIRAAAGGVTHDVTVYLWVGPDAGSPDGARPPPLSQ